MRSIALPVAPAPSLWRYARTAGIVLTLVLIGALVAWPAEALHILWDVVIPLLPLVFLINPVIWRNVCPLATLNAWSGTRWGTKALGPRWTNASWVAGVLLLAAMVPARRFLFNTNGLAMAATITVVALLALASGVVFARRAAFCNGLCPVLPVEKLYGQHPLLQVGTARCGSCSVCTPAGCQELAGTKTVAQTLGPTRRDASWLLTPFGVFAAAFPGFVAAYFTTDNAPIAGAVEIYAYALALSGASYVIVLFLTASFDLPAWFVTVLLGGGSLGLYYWFAAETLATSLGGAGGATAGIRAALFVVIATWMVRGLRHSGEFADRVPLSMR